MEHSALQVHALSSQSSHHRSDDKSSLLSLSNDKTQRSRATGLVGPFVLSVLVAFLLLGFLIAQDPWKVLAVTRVLDLLIEGGIVQYHDRQPGFISGVPLPKYYYWSQEAIDWRLVGIAGLLMMLYPSIKAIQFHCIAKAYGSSSSFSRNFTAYIYGDGLDRYLPFNMGMIGTANALVADGMDRERATAAVTLSRIFTLFEICAFALLGLLLVGWASWISHIFWAIVVCVVAYYLVSSTNRSPAAPRISDIFILARGDLLARSRSSAKLFIASVLLSLLAFGTVDVAIYVLMAAFDTAVLAISVDPSVLLMSIVGGYIAARIVPITPGGIGQWEVGFAATLLLADTDVSIPLLCIGILANVLRIVTGIALMVIVTRGADLGTRLGEVFTVFLYGPSKDAALRANGHASGFSGNGKFSNGSDGPSAAIQQERF